MPAVILFVNLAAKGLAEVEGRQANGGNGDDRASRSISGLPRHPVPHAGSPATHDGDGLTPREGGGDGEESGGKAAGVGRSPPGDVVPIRIGTKERRVKRLRDKVKPGKLKDTASTVLESVQTVPRKSSSAARAAVGRVRTGSRQALNSASRHADEFLATTQGLLASALAVDLNGMIAGMVAGPATIYDKAMDAAYIATRIGGGNHRLFDGGHTILGAFRAVRDASPDDTIVKEAMGLLQGLFRDMTTPKGLPLANWDKATYDKVSDFLASKLSIPKDWFHDLNTYDAAQLLGGVVGVVATALCWNRADTESFARLVGGMGVSALARTNPLLLLVTVVALARAFHKAHHTGEYAELVDGQLKGGVSAGATLVAASQVAAFGGPAGLALLVGMTAGVLVHQATQNVSVVQIGEFVADRATVAATEMRAMAERCSGALEATPRSLTKAAR